MENLSVGEAEGIYVEAQRLGVVSANQSSAALAALRHPALFCVSDFVFTFIRRATHYGLL